jgi:hypothetical protein
MKYWIKYRQITGLGQPVFKEWFPTLDARVSAYHRIMGAGYKILGFGQVA